MLMQAFRNYRVAARAADPNEKAQLMLLANLEIGFHEQTRLQPEIEGALNGALFKPGDLADLLVHLDYRVDLSSDQVGWPKNIEPKHENHDRTQRAVRGAVMIEEMQVHAESVRGTQPNKHTKCSTWGNPVPATPLRQIRTKAINQRTRQENEKNNARPLNRFPRKDENRM